MQDDRDATAAVAWREVFDELLVFEQEFDTAMQILMFQDEKVARMALEDRQETRNLRTRRVKTCRSGARIPNRKRRRTEVTQADRAEPPTPPLSGYTQSSVFWSQSPSAAFDSEADTQMQDPCSSMLPTQLPDASMIIAEEDVAHETNAMLLQSAGLVPNESHQANEQKYQKETEVRYVAIISSASAESTVPSLFTTGSGKSVLVSKSRIRAYEEKMQREVEGVDGGTATSTSAESTVPSLFTTGSGKSVLVSKSRIRAYEEKMQREVEGVDGGTATSTSAESTVPSLFTTGSGKSVLVSKSRMRAYEEKMQREVEDVDGGTATSTSAESTVPSLFTTGSGKSVLVSKSRIRAYEEKMQREVEGVDGGTATSTSAESTVPSLFTTGSGKSVLVSKSRIRAYEEKMQREVEGVDGGTATSTSAESTVPSLFTTGSGKSVLVSKSRIRAYEEKMQREVEDVDGGTATSTSAESTVPSLFTTGSGKSVLVSKSRMRAYEEKMQREVEDVDGGTATSTSAESTVPSLFTTGSGKSVLVSKSRIRAYEEKMQREVEGVDGGTATSTAESTVPSLFTTGSGKSVLVSKSRMRAYEEKMQREECSESIPQSVGYSRNSIHGGTVAIVVYSGDEQTSALNRGKTGLELKMVPNSLSGTGDKMKRQTTIGISTRSLLSSDRGATVPTHRSLQVAYPLAEIHRRHGRGLECGDKENFHPENVLIQKTTALEASKSWRSSLSSKQLNSRRVVQLPAHQVARQKMAKRSLKSSIEPRSKMIGKRRFRPPVASKRLCESNAKNFHDIGHITALKSKKKKVVDTRPLPFIYQESMKISLTALMGLHDDRRLGDEDYDVPRLQVLNYITAENALKVRFARDGSLSCSSDESYDTALFAGPHELYRQLRAGNHILKAMGATFRWFLNHYRWIIWKLAAMERSFPRLLLAKYLTKNQVLKQITHRYQRDLNDAQRSILKRVLQRDASSLSCMVLCVAAVLPFPADKSNSVDLELPACWNMALVLTDGWYSVYAVPDAPLAAVLWKLHAKSSLIGSKVATWNASLQNSTEGVDPLECAIVREAQWKNPLLSKEDLLQWPYLQLRYNSTRRVRFDMRLGVEKLHYMTPTNSRHRKQQPQLTFSLLKSVPLKSLEVGGGMVRSVRVRVTRISPILHLQAKEWTLGPRILCEEQLPLYFQLRSEYAQVVMRKKHQQDGVGTRAGDWLDDEQIDVPPPTPFVKVDVECTHPSGNEEQGVGCGVLTIWRPSEELLSGGIREGVEYFVSSLTVNWKLGGRRGQDAYLRLSSTKHSGFEEVHEEITARDDEIKEMAQQTGSQRVCVDVQQATMDYRANYEDGSNGRRNERRPTIDVCVYVVLVAARETQENSSSSRRQPDVSLLDPEMKPKESRYVEHIFVTDQSCHLMSIRVSGMEVSMPKKKSNSPLKQTASSSFVFRRGSKNIWKEGAILCLSGLEVSHYDEQLRVLDCILVESTQIVSFPSKKSAFWNHFQLFHREGSISTTRGSAAQVSNNFANELKQLKKYVERDILQMDFVPSQESNEHAEVIEQERLTQDLQAHEEGGDNTTMEQGDDKSSNTQNHLRWVANVVKILPLLGANSFMFPRDMVALACVNVGADDTTFRTVYLTKQVLLSMRDLLQETGATTHYHREDEATATNAAFVHNVTELLDKIKEQNTDYTFRFEVRQSTNERLMNSWKPWEGLHASYWIAVTVAPAK